MAESKTTLCFNQVLHFIVFDAKAVDFTTKIKCMVMIKNQWILIIVITIMMAACNNRRSSSPEQWSEEELSEWFSEGSWKQGYDATPDESVNKREFAIRYHRNPERWNKAFSFLATENHQDLEKGRYEIEGSDLFATVDEYVPKRMEDARFESHRVYADIQVVVSGQEQIGLAPYDATVITVPYDEEKDIMFMSAAEAEDMIASPGRFFLFFPSDAHRPSVRVNENDSSLVKKVVIKVKLD
jgi:YhcH/YjgK/YiaL family protein